MAERTLWLAAGCALDAVPFDLATAAARAGFDGVGLRVSGEHALDERSAARLQRHVGDLGLVISDVEVIRIGDPTGAAPAVLDIAATLGAARVLVVSDVADVSLTRDVLGALASHAGELGVGLGLEYMAWTTPTTPALALDLAAACGAQVVCDVLHHHRVGATADDVTALVEGKVLGWVQICDAPVVAPTGGVDALVHEARHERLAPGEGALPATEFLARVPFDVPFSVEVQSDTMRRGFDLSTRLTLLHGAAQRWNTIGYRPK